MALTPTLWQCYLKSVPKMYLFISSQQYVIGTLSGLSKGFYNKNRTQCFFKCSCIDASVGSEINICLSMCRYVLVASALKITPCWEILPESDSVRHCSWSLLCVKGSWQRRLFFLSAMQQLTELRWGLGLPETNTLWLIRSISLSSHC